MNVVFPAPLGPMRPNALPFGMLSVSSRSAGCGGPKSFSKVLESPVATMAWVGVRGTRPR